MVASATAFTCDFLERLSVHFLQKTIATRQHWIQRITFAAEMMWRAATARRTDRYADVDRHNTCLRISLMCLNAYASLQHFGTDGPA